jgi:4-amino-4-deoxy-L-arabinose transferase-like glycosyltransferase
MPTADRTDAYWTSGLVLAFVVLRLVTASMVPLSPDEAYYFDWSRHLAFGYYDHPPMVAWWIAAGTAALGDGPLGIRIVTILSVIPTSAAVYFAGKALFDRAVASRAVLWLNVTLLIGVGGFLATPDAPSVLFWALATWALAEVVRRNDGRWWLLVGVFAGLGVVSKLTNLFLGLGLVLALLARRDLRRWLISPWLWAGALIAELVATPFLAWNMTHNWVTLRQFARIGSGELQLLKVPEFFVTQFGLLNPLMAIFVGVAAVYWVQRKSTGVAVLLWTALPLLAYLTLHAFHQQVQGNWPAPIYPTLALVAAAAAEAASARWEALRASTFPVGALLVVIGLALAANPGGILPPSLDPGLILRGWEKVASDVDLLRRANNADWVAGTNYAGTAVLAYDLRPVPVVPVTERVRYEYAPAPEAALLVQPVLIVTGGEPGYLAHCFTGLTKVGTIDRVAGAHVLETLTVFRAEGAMPAAFAEGCDRLP